MAKDGKGKVKTWRNFCNETTFHGIKNIFAKESSLFRRIGWILIVFGAIFLFIFQVVKRGLDYSKKEVTDSVQVIYAKSLQFPSVTVCNQNQFRMKSTVELEVYKYFNNLYNTNTNGTASHNQYLPRNMNDDAKYVYNYIGHQQSDFLFNCHWNGKECPSQYIAQTITEFGICFTFNSPRSSYPLQPVTVTEPGMEKSLSFLVNIEQYEHMPGPRNDAGVKILLHDDFKKPLMSNLGFAVAPGMHTLVGIKRIESQNLGEPYGDCVNSKYKSHAECIDHCQLKAVATICKCIPFIATAILQSTNDYNRKCSLSENHGCIRRSLEKLKSNENNCSCHVPCHQIVYEPNLSFSAISGFTVNKLILKDSERMLKLREKYLQVLEIGEKNSKELFDLNKQYITAFTKGMRPFFLKFINTFDAFEINKTGDGESFVSRILAKIRNDCTDILHNVELMETALQSPKIVHVYKSFTYLMQVENHFKGQLFGPSPVNENRILDDFHSCTDNVNKTNGTWRGCDDFMQHFQFSSFKVEEENFHQFWDKAIKSVQNLIHHLKSVQNLQNYHIDEIERIFGLDINDTRLPFMEYCNPIYNDLITLRENDTDVDTNAKIRFVLQTYFRIEKILNNENFQSYCLLNRKKEFFQRIYRSIEDIARYGVSIHWYIKGVQRNIEKITKIHLDAIEKILMFESYLEVNSSVKKQNLSDPLLLEDFLKDLRSLIGFSENMPLEYRTFIGRIDEFATLFFFLEERFLSLRWPFPKNDAQNKTIKYKDINQFYTIYNEMKVKYDIYFSCSKDDLQQIKDWYRCVMIMGNAVAKHTLDYPISFNQKLSDILSKYNDLQEFMYTFHRNSFINKEFLLKNFAKVDIFYKEMNFQRIIQHEKFGFLSFLSEIGGFLGLVLGASVITLFEFLDFFAYKISYSLSAKMR
ncbi:DgyrCDS14629 [Dimorphilus gyrociliatus]|uniref:DgyrCDS14629 n=1 Tax=Dimorphilus gyrociliatus TaxID=2664684 RepID=A0A7I8WEB3_9ANNE|nr:DgyrCDS14629 [Dimorphilus gyrociliatus]